MHKITASPETLLTQSHMTAKEYLHNAIEAIDDHFGRGYAKANPTLVIAMMNVAEKDFVSASAIQAFQEIAEEVIEAVRPISAYH